MSLALLLAASANALTPTLPPRRTDDLARRMLVVHNQARAEVGAPPLQWDEGLAQSAASYGPRLAALGRLVHSPREDRPGQRENLAMDLDWRGTPESMATMWVDEKSLFVPGTFPEVTRTGRWEDVAHYTQMIWKGTTHVGCAIHDEKGWRYLICRYSPPGNRDGNVVP
ncbi:CAP domain-containing protein [Sphingomonas sp. LHG3406-1]|uniref:CAP domain-containing protein n=1 Tax=Sphingomonas sp. LHG3406-1 TaxID=2804617 RepID=UPI0026183690|nr:CAP domain-containing protein [Sphingomonas sp. LHG3406-1]